MLHKPVPVARARFLNQLSRRINIGLNSISRPASFDKINFLSSRRALVIVAKASLNTLSADVVHPILVDPIGPSLKSG